MTAPTKFDGVNGVVGVIGVPTVPVSVKEEGLRLATGGAVTV